MNRSYHVRLPEARYSCAKRRRAGLSPTFHSSIKTWNVCGPSQPPVDRCPGRFTATTERSPPGNRPAMAADRGNDNRPGLGCGPSQPPVDRCQGHFTATTERSPPGNRPAMAADCGNDNRPGLGRGPSQRVREGICIVSTAPTERTPFRVQGIDQRWLFFLQHCNVAARTASVGWRNLHHSFVPKL